MESATRTRRWLPSPPGESAQWSESAGRADADIILLGAHYDPRTRAIAALDAPKCSRRKRRAKWDVHGKGFLLCDFAHDALAASSANDLRNP